MGILFTESFQRFATGTFDVLGGNPARPIQTDSEWREMAGFSNYLDSYNNNYQQVAAYGTVGIYPDPIVPTKKRLGMNIDHPSNSHFYNMDYALDRVFPTPRTKYIAGFLVRFNALTTLAQNPGQNYNEGHGFEFCASGRTRNNASATLQPNLTLVGGQASTLQSAFGADNWGRPTVAWWSMTSAMSSYITPPTFRIRGQADPNGAGIQLKWDTDHFFEVEVDTVAQTIKIWVDDIYAGLAPWTAADANLDKGFQLRLFRGEASNVTYRLSSIYLSDIYCLDLTDGQTPNTRLGKTTRVMGEAPDVDVMAQFKRPDGFTSNADVINDPVANTAYPTQMLTGDGAGTEDLYGQSASVVQSTAGFVHGVTIRARFQNASGTSHEMAITADDGTRVVNSLGTVAAGSGLITRSVVLNKTPSGDAWTPAKAAALKYGFKIVT